MNTSLIVNKDRPKLTMKQILIWADAHHGRTGAWPRSDSGPVDGQTGLTWRRLDAALRFGLRGMPGGSSLARLLSRCRRVRNLQDLPPLTEEQVLAWADAHQRRTGRWPTARSGRIDGAPGEVWYNVDASLRDGVRGLPGGSSLARLLAERREVRNRLSAPPLTVDQILAWADAYHKRTGKWPHRHSGAIPEAPGETWRAVHNALEQGRRGLKGGSSLGGLLAQRRGVRDRGNLPRLTVAEIRTWARTHQRRTGEWPTRAAGAVIEAPGETWGAIDLALRHGLRGLQAGSSLARLQLEPERKPPKGR